MGKTKKRVGPDEARSRVYRLCNRKQYFTGGSSGAYEKMFSLVEDERPVNEIAIAIWVCSHDASLKTINEDLEEVLFDSIVEE